MKGVGRTLWFFKKQAEEYLVVLIVICAGMMAIMYAGSESGAGVENLIHSLPYYMGVYSMLMMVVLGVTNFTYTVPITLSFNCTRRSLCIGTQYLYLMLGGQIILLILGYAFLFAGDGKEPLLRIMPAMIGLMFGCIGVGELLGGIVVRFGKIGMILMVIICGLCGGVIGAVVGYTGGNLNLKDFAGKLGGINMILLIGALVYVVCFGLNYLSLRKVSVKG